MISSILALALPLALQVHAAPISSSVTAEGLDISETLQNILSNNHNSGAYSYPTDLTRGIVPKPIHSHNDYWRDVPFYSALSVGAVSVEADVYLINGTLYIGHEQSALTEARTLESLYINPILDVLQRENPITRFVTSPTRNGVFDTSSGQTLYLFIDLKTNGTTTWPAVVDALQPLRDAKYLTTWNGTAVTPGPVTVIGTGNTPLNLIAPLSQRDYFFDANLALLNSSQANITSGISPVASTQFSRYIGEIEGTEFNDTQLATLRSHLRLAASKGIVGRYWDTPAYPISTRNSVWKTLIEEGVGLLNADNLPEAAGFGGINGYW